MSAVPLSVSLISSSCRTLSPPAATANMTPVPFSAATDPPIIMPLPGMCSDLSSTSS